ncbi:hypothetical protein HF086_000406 [Spodoptera exigua]|uniref:Uncharacterized protein n=1 Tax=Spodoptera exigua TaxID=7107 RepID=A0A922SCX0_SPOEX|nr:hypothetical protein HF086_000406 [Spodoptera exigua]
MLPSNHLNNNETQNDWINSMEETAKTNQERETEEIVASWDTENETYLDEITGEVIIREKTYAPIETDAPSTSYGMFGEPALLPQFSEDRRHYPAEVDNPKFVSLYEDVMFDEPIQEHDYSMSSSASRGIVSYKYDAVLQDINLNDLGSPNTPLNVYSPKITSIQKPSPLALTPASIEPLFSVVTNDPSDSLYNTPVPSPYCDF